MIAVPRSLKHAVCDIGRRAYQRQLVAAHEGNFSVRIDDQYLLCTPTQVCKGMMQPEDLAVVDMQGTWVSGPRPPTSEIRLHTTILRHCPEVNAVVHTHPPHATAFGVAGQPIPQGVLPELDGLLGEVPIAPYALPGTQEFADTVLPFVQTANTVVLAHHGVVSFAESLERAYWLTESLDACCRTLLLARQWGEWPRLTREQIQQLRRSSATSDSSAGRQSFENGSE